MARRRIGIRKFGRVIAVAAVVVLLSAACGSDDSEPDSTEVTPDQTDAGTTATDDPASADDAEPTDDEADNSASDGGTIAADTATVTLDGQTYVADLLVCISLGGAVGGNGRIQGMEDASISVDVPPEDYENSGEDWQPPSVGVDLGEDADGVPIDWRAGGEVVATFPDLEGKSQVDSYSVDGTSASGTATFIDFFQAQLFASGQVAEPQPVDGTFEINCG